MIIFQAVDLGCPPLSPLGGDNRREVGGAPSYPYDMDNDAPRPDAPLDDSEYTITVDDAAERYARAGHPRTIRRIQKYCARGDLQCRKMETAFGEKYLITPVSVDRHIAQIVDALAASGHVPARPDAPEGAVQLSHNSDAIEPAPTPASARPGAPDFQTRYLEHLEKENSFLREQNTVLLERVKETNILTGRLQEMLTPLLGAPADRGSEPAVRTTVSDQPENQP